MAVKMHQDEGLITQAELDFFIKGNVSLSKSERKCPVKWITEQVRSRPRI